MLNTTVPNNPLLSELEIKALHDQVIAEYKSFEDKLKVNWITDKVSYQSPVNFNESMTKPRHRWFPYKEGFSPSFVSSFISNNGIDRNSGIVFDPFSGVGTTPIVGGESGFSSFGVDVSPLSSFIAKTKAIEFDRSELFLFLEQIEDFNFAELKDEYPKPNNETVVKYYSKDYLSALLMVRNYIEKITSRKNKDLFFLAYLSILEYFSTHKRAGNGVKIKTKLTYSSEQLSPLVVVKRKLISILREYHSDLCVKPKSGDITIVEGSALDENLYKNLAPIAGVITSPPYANCFDYSKIYLRELWLGDFFKNKEDHAGFRESSIRSHVHATWNERNSDLLNPIVETLIRPALYGQKLWSKKIPSMLSGYFKDMSRVLQLVHPKCIAGARLGFVVSNSFYGGIPIATDLLVAQSALELGFKVISIDVYRSIVPSSQQYKRIEDKYFMRESLVILEKV